MAETIVNIVLHKMAHVVVQEPVFLYRVRDKVDPVQRELTRIQAYLKDADTESHKDERVKQWENEILEVGYLVDNVLDKFLAKVGGDKLGGLRNILKRIGKMPMKLIAEHKVRNEMHQILQRMEEINENRTTYGIYLRETSSGASIELPVPNPDIEMAEMIVNLVLGKLADAVVQETLLFYRVRDKVERFQRDLKWIRSFLKYANTKSHKYERVKQWVNEVQEVGYLIRDILDKLLAEFGGDKLGGFRSILKRIGKIPMKLIAKHKVDNEIHNIQQRLCEIKENTTKYEIPHLVETSSGASIKISITNPGLEMAETISNLVLSKLADPVVRETLFHYGVRDKVEWVQRDLKWIRSLFIDAGTEYLKCERVKHLVNGVQEVRHLFEDVLDKFLAEVGGARREGLCNKLKRIGKMPMKLSAKHKVGNKIDQIQETLRAIELPIRLLFNRDIDEAEVVGFEEHAKIYGVEGLKAASSGATVEQPIRPLFNRDIDETEVVGFEVDRKTIVNQLLDTNITMRAFISIVGAGGIGKTTLAKEVYKSAEVKRHFSIFMWLPISQDWKVNDILMKMFEQIFGELTLEMWNKGEEYFINKLNTSMKERKFLVVMDDVWSCNVWNQLKFALPDANNGSRVLITSRFLNIVEEVDGISKSHVIQPLNEEESKQLLLKKVFPNEFANKCPNDLLPLATQFTKKCGGYPLALVVISGILSKKNHDYTTWVEVMKTIDWHTDGSSFMGAISTSYDDLPAVLKPCFMYFGVFPENYQIKATTLIQLWIAEGLIQGERRSLEDIAEDYLNELVRRCMVQVSRTSFIGKIKYCHIHVLLWELAIQKANEKNFLTVVLKNDTKLSSSTCARHVALHVYDDNMIEHANTDLRSLISFAHVPNFNKFGTLRVLHISTGPYEFSTGEKYYWTALKYFGFECGLYSYCQLPTGKSLKRSHLTYMNNVQTVRTWFCKSHDELPPYFWGNKQLRHINITCCFFCEAAPEGPPSAADLPSLLTLKGVRARQDWVSQLPKFPNIRKLGIVIPEDVEGEPLMNLLSKLNHLVSLHLEMSSSKQMTFPSCIWALRNHNHLNSFSLVESIWPRKGVVDYTLFPPHLVKLTLERFCFEEDPMPPLENLPNLRGLKLSGKIEAADVKQIICSTGGFAHLQGLLLEVRNLEEWKIEEGAMPMLNQLVLKRCRKLQVVPDLQYLSNLQQLTVHHCLDQFNSRLQGEDKWKIKDFTSVSVFPWLSC